MKTAKKKGVNWSAAKLVTYTTDTTSAVGPEMEMFKSSGIKNMKGVIDFTSGDSAYQMSFDKLIYVPAEGGWFGGEFEQVIRKGESFLQTGETRIEAASSDTTFITTEVPKDIKTKTKSKSSGVKTKVKTKSPARKPATKS
ncbi:MAG TPA: hypothetical protein VM884_02780 [Flavisolibacter sp.]|nr:hypothetical protein [Flavisolibacter sp.]